MKLGKMNLPLKLKKIDIPFLPSKKILGVDLGSQTIKIVELEQSKNGKWTLKKCAFESLGIAEIPPEEKKTILIERLKEALSREKFSTKRVATSLSGNQVIVRYVKFPKLSAEELAKTIHFEAEAYIPFDIREVDLAFHILGDLVEEGEKKMETVLVAVKKDVIQNRIEILEKVGLEPAIIDIDAFAIESALELARQPVSTERGEAETKETIVVVNLGASVTNLTIIENGISKVVRDIFIAGNTFTKVIQQSLNLDFPKAEELKRKHGLSTEEVATPEITTSEEKSSEKVEVAKVLTTVISDLIKEIQHSIEYYQSQLPEEVQVSRVLLTGGSALLSNIGRYFAQELQLPVEIYNPFLYLNTPVNLPKEINEKNTIFTIAIGLAIRQ
jgi:type IV pilus assembly protein PilM